MLIGLLLYIKGSIKHLYLYQIICSLAFYVFRLVGLPLVWLYC